LRAGIDGGAIYLSNPLLDIQSQGDVSVLHNAASCAKEEVMHLLLDHGANLEATAKVCSLVAEDSVLSRRDLIHMLLQRGETPLHRSLQWNNTSSLKVLLGAGANINAKDTV
jgi:ankyrin repeat protein